MSENKEKGVLVRHIRLSGHLFSYIDLIFPKKHVVAAGDLFVPDSINAAVAARFELMFA